MEGDKRRDVTNYYTEEQELHMLIWGYWGQVSCFLLLTFEEAKKKKKKIAIFFLLPVSVNVLKNYMKLPSMEPFLGSF